MDISTIAPLVSKQVLVMLILIIAGYVLTKRNIITKQGSSEMSAVLVNLVTPCVMIRAYHIPFDADKVGNIVMGYGISIGIHIIYALLAYLYFKPLKDKESALISRNSAIMSNCGFMGIPLLEASLGNDGVFYGSAYLGIFNIFMWSVVKFQFERGKEKFSFKSLINPGIIGVLTGIAFYVTQIKLPSFVYNAVSFAADLNTPLAMLVIGSFLARSGILSSLKQIRVYNVLSVKLIFAPLLLLVIMKLLNMDEVLTLSVILCAACPTAALVPIFAERYNSDYIYATNITVASTVLSMITIPLLCFICGYIL